MKNIVLVIDWQKIYIRCGETPARYKGQAVRNTAKIIESARKNSDDIIWVAFTKSDDVFDPARPDGIIPELAALRQDGDRVFTKMKSDAFSNPDFAAWIHTQQFDRLIFTGFSMFDCVRATMEGAVARGYGDKCVVARDACGPAPARGNAISHVFRQLSDYYGGQAVSTARLISAMDADCAVDKTIPYQDNTHLRGQACAKIWTSAAEVDFDLYMKMGVGGKANRFSENTVNAWAGNANIDRYLLAELFNTKQDVLFSPAHFRIMQKLAANLPNVVAKQYKK